MTRYRRTATRSDPSGTAVLPPALVAGADTPTGLAFARGLARAGISAVGLAPDPSAPACRSRHWQAVLPVDADDSAGWLAAFRACHARYGRMTLLPTDDLAVRAIAEHAAELRTLFDFVLPDLPVVERLLDKTLFHDWAATNGFPVPLTFVVRDRDELDGALEQVWFPVVLKPSERTPGWQRASRRDKVLRFDEMADLRDVEVPLFDVADRYVVQEWIDGLDSDVHFCLVYRDRHGHEVAAVTGRKLAQWPVGTGSSALCVTTDDDELLLLTRKVLDAAGHVGLGSLEVRRDRRDGRCYITEPTVGRPNLQTALATAAGVNLAEIAYRDATDLPRPVATRTRPAMWVHETALPRSLVVAARNGVLDRAALRSALWSVLRPGLARAGAFGARRDQRPLFDELARLAGKALGGTTGARASSTPAPDKAA